MLGMMMRGPTMYTASPMALVDALFDNDFAFANAGERARAMKRLNENERSKTKEIGRPRIEETSRGFLITAHAPGVRAGDVKASVTTKRGHAKLRIDVEGSSSPLELGLPTKYIDITVAPKASCIDGVLRVAVLKRTAETLRVPISSTPDEGMETDDEGSTITLSVPGFGAADISVTLERPEDSLVVEGDSKNFGKFKKTVKNLPADIELSHISASVAHGLLKITMQDPHAIDPMDIAVSSLESDMTTTESAVTLVRRHVPGVSADNVSCRLTADRMLHVEVKTSNGRAALSTSVSRNVDHSTIRAACANGILSVVAEPTKTETETHVLQIDVSGDSPAALVEATVEAALPSTEKPTEVEDFDGKIEDVAA